MPAAQHMGDDDRDTGSDLVQQLRLRWGVRCIFARTSFLATAGPDALALCASVVAALESPKWSPGLALAARRWRSTASSPDDAASALRSLSETVVEVASSEYGESPPPGLDSVVQQLIGEAASASARRAGTDGVDITTGCPNRLAFERDLDDAVTEALAELGDVALALAEVDPSARRDEGALSSLVAAVRRSVGGPQRVYRVGTCKLAVLLPGEDVPGAGAIMLRATCSGAPRFTWGVSGLRSAGIETAERAEALVVLAEADMHLRRRDYSHARRMLARHRRNTALSAVAAAMVLVAGVTLGVGSTAQHPSHIEAARPAPRIEPPAPGAVPTPAAAVPTGNATPVPAMSVPAHGTLASFVTPAPPGQPGPAGSPPPPPGSVPLPLPPPPSPPPAPPPVPQLLSSAQQLLDGLVGSLTSL